MNPFGGALSDKRSLLCLPHGGLNDTFCQIERCWRYSRRHERLLMIDTRRSCLHGPFSNYFMLPRPDPRIVFLGQTADLELLDDIACRPAALQGRISQHPTGYSAAFRNLIDRVSGERLSFDFRLDHPESLLLHEQCGGGKEGGPLLARLRLVPEIRDLACKRLARLPPDYVGIHVRNTDHSTDYEALYRQVLPRIEGRTVLICSDDALAISRARQVFDRATVITAIDLPDTGNRPLHRRDSHASDTAHREAMIAALIDLLALGQASEVIFANVAAGYPSGFSRLATYLCANKPVLKALLSTVEPQQAKS